MEKMPLGLPRATLVRRSLSTPKSLFVRQSRPTQVENTSQLPREERFGLFSNSTSNRLCCSYLSRLVKRRHRNGKSDVERKSLQNGFDGDVEPISTRLIPRLARKRP